MAERLTPKQARERVDALARLATIRGARFPDDNAEKRLARMARAIVLPEYFAETYLPHYFRDPPAAFHRRLYRAIEADNRVVVRAPRGHAKSTVITFAYTLHQVVCAAVLRAWERGTLEAENPALYRAIRAELGAHPEAMLVWDPYIQIVCVTDDLAEAFTADIKLDLENNELLRSDWGELIEAGQAAGDWVANGVRVKAFGMNANLRGGKHGAYRPTLAIVDDPDSEESTSTIRQRDGRERKLLAALNYGLEPKKSRVVVIGTPVHADCLVCRLTDEKRPQFGRWTKLRFRAIAEDGAILWPERWSREDLLAEEAESPEVFAMEMNDTPPNEGDRPFSQLHTYSRAAFLDKLPTVLAFDPSMGKTKDSDYQAVIVLRGPTRDGRILIQRIELLRIGDPERLVDTVLRIWAEEAPDRSAIETIGFQALLETMLSSAGRSKGLFPGWERVERQIVSKDLRIRGLAPLINQGVIRFPDDGTCRLLERQAREYPDGKKDGLDAMEMALRLLRTPATAELWSQIRHVRRLSAGREGPRLRETERGPGKSRPRGGRIGGIL